MRVYLIIAFLWITHISAFSQEKLIIKGNVIGDTKGFNKVYIYGTNTTQDSTLITNGQFKFEITYHPGIIPLFYTEYDKKVLDGYISFGAVVDRGGTLFLKDIDISKGLLSGRWEGIASAEEYQEIANHKIFSDREITDLASKYRLKKEDPYFIKKLKEIEIVRLKTYYINYLKAHPNSYGLIAFMNETKGVTWLSTLDLEFIYNLLSEALKESIPGRELGAYLLGLKKSGIGKFVDNFVLKTPADTDLNFDSFKGKYILVDFWASWCYPCRKSVPYLKVLYQKYKGEKFEIYSISIDNNKKAWLTALDQDKLPWSLALDNGNIAGGKFGVRALPTTFLIDPDGEILIREEGVLEGKKGEIELMLEEIFGSR